MSSILPSAPPGAIPRSSMGPLPPNETRGPTINIVAWICASIATIFTLLRLYSRKYVTRTLGWSDAIVAFTALINILATAFTSVAISYGLGRHAIYIPPENVTPALFWGAIVRPLSVTACCLPKLSVVLLIISLLGTERKGVWFLWTVIVILFLTSGLSFIMLFAQCNPPDHLWHPFEKADCYPDAVLDTISYIAGSWSAFTDLVLAVFPAVLLRNLQVKRQKKIIIISLMGLGFFAMIAAIAKTTQLSKNYSDDASYELFWLFITAIVETNLVIVAACAPPLPRLVMRIMGKDDVPTSHQSPFGSKQKSAFRGYRAFDSDYSMGMDTIQKQVVVSQHSQDRGDFV